MMFMRSPPRPQPARHARRRAEVVAVARAALVALVVTGCSTPEPPRFHTLLPRPAATPVSAAAVSMIWQVGPVQVPAQVDQPQFVVRRADDTLAQLEMERWAAPLQDEIRAALAEHLTTRLGPPLLAPGIGRKDWRIGIDVQRFDSTPGRSSLVVQWMLVGGGVASGGATTLRCRTSLEQAVEPGIAPLAAGHRKLIERLAETIAPVLRALDAGQRAGCPAAT